MQPAKKKARMGLDRERGGLGGTSTDGMNIKCSPMACRPKNRIRIFVEDLLKNHHSGGNTQSLPPMMNLSLGDPTALGLKPPAEAAGAITQVLEESSTKEAHGYQHSCGVAGFREAIVTHALRGTGAAVEDVFVTSGCSQALQFSLMTLCSEGSNVLIPCPCFPLYNTICELVGAEARPYKLNPHNNWEAYLEDLEAKCDERTACLLVCNPGNPTSHAYTPKHLEELLRFAYRRGIPVVADEVYAHMTFDVSGGTTTSTTSSSSSSSSPREDSEGEETNGNQFQWLAEIALNSLGRERPPVLSCSALSKRFLVPGWRLGWLALFDDAAESLKRGGIHDGMKALVQIGMTPNSLLQAAAPSILENTPQSYHSELLETIRKGARYCVERCNACKGLQCLSEPKGAMYFMPRIDPDVFPKLGEGNGEPVDIAWTKALLAETNVFMLPGTLFGAPGFVRIVAAAPIEVLREAWDRIQEFCDKKSNSL